MAVVDTFWDLQFVLCELFRQHLSYSSNRKPRAQERVSQQCKPTCQFMRTAPTEAERVEQCQKHATRLGLVWPLLAPAKKAGSPCRGALRARLRLETLPSAGQALGGVPSEGPRLLWSCSDARAWVSDLERLPSPCQCLLAMSNPGKSIILMTRKLFQELRQVHDDADFDAQRVAKCIQVRIDICDMRPPLERHRFTLIQKAGGLGWQKGSEAPTCKDDVFNPIATHIWDFTGPTFEVIAMIWATNGYLPIVSNLLTELSFQPVTQRQGQSHRDKNRLPSQTSCACKHRCAACPQRNWHEFGYIYALNGKRPFVGFPVTSSKHAPM
eukprot:6470067-Amphidinium_carterae.1